MTPEEIHQLAEKIYADLNENGAGLGSFSIILIEKSIEEFQYIAFCEVKGCWNDAYVEGWHRAGTMIRKMRVCKEHMDILIGKEITE